MKLRRIAKRHNGFKPRLVIDFDITWYGVIKHVDGTENTLKMLLDDIIKTHPHIIDGSLYWHLNGNNLAVSAENHQQRKRGELFDRRLQTTASGIIDLWRGRQQDRRAVYGVMRLRFNSKKYPTV